MLEVCIDSLESAANAINGGADELEVCSALNDGGLTPGYGLVYEILEMVKKLPTNRPKVNVMIRCRGGDDFLFSDIEMKQMLSDVKIYKEMGVDQFVFGALTDNHEIDESKCMTFLNAASPHKVTFSRAFDQTAETKKSAGILASLGFYRVLTSGQRANVNEPGAFEILAYLISRYSSDNEELVIMPGGGINCRNVAYFINIGCKIVHSSCRSAIQLPKMELAGKLGVSDNNYLYLTDYDTVRKMKQSIMAALR